MIPVGCFFRLKNWYKRELREAGVKVYASSAIYPIHTLTYRNHRKIAVIDGCIGYTGGLNLGQEHLDPGGGFARWRDTHLRVEGEAATILQAVFAVDWENATGEALTESGLFPGLRRTPLTRRASPCRSSPPVRTRLGAPCDASTSP